MALTYQGSQTLGGALPVAAAASASASASLAGQLPALTAQIGGMLEVSPPVLTVDLIANLASLTAALTTMIGLGVAVIPPSINLEAAADLQLTQAALQASIDLQTSIAALFAAGGIGVYSYEGAANQLGPDVTAALNVGLPGGSGPTQTVTGILFVCADPASAVALKTMAGL